ncbi:AbrB/MazE/SpoVT family DNA-binding domain-containing protein [Candidatus Woesearchaeota archaeon]|nr:AbrB/MazE/SpoVT family DNA-binding domain-containing protein [Candidatus Woesearchaeota archaeon]
MEEALVKTKKWGNSLGVVLPADVVKAEHLKPGEEIRIRVERKHNVLKEMFGAVKFKRPIEVILKEAREEMKSKWDK